MANYITDIIDKAIISWYSGYSKETGANTARKGKTMRTVFAANTLYLHSEYLKALKSEKKQSSIMMRSCGIRKSEKLFDVR